MILRKAIAPYNSYFQRLILQHQLKKTASDAIPIIALVLAVVTSVPPDASLVSRNKTFRI
jgi:hypothetical protein